MLMNMTEMLSVARQNHFAVPAFNVGTSEILKGVIETCEEREAPVIIQIHSTELEFAGNSFADMVLAEAKKAKVPVVIHLDHGNTVEEIMRAVRVGFTSVMIDASAYPYEENVRRVKEIVKLVHPLGISVEAELGTIGSTGNGAEGGCDCDRIQYTDPAQAVQFMKESGADTLAVAIGTAHGIYPEGFVPKLKLELLKELREAVEAPLVLHGGSNNPDEEIQIAAHTGISKLNIASDIKAAFFEGVRDALKNPDIREPHEVYGAALPYMKEVINHKIDLFGCAQTAGLYK